MDLTRWCSPVIRRRDARDRCELVGRKESPADKQKQKKKFLGIF